MDWDEVKSIAIGGLIVLVIYSPIGFLLAYAAARLAS